MRLVPLRSRRIPLLWAGFLLAALAAALAFHRLYHTVREEIVAQSERALQQERARAQERVRDYTALMRQTIVEKLVSFHVDGLASTLRRWDESSDLVVHTFLWDPARGFPSASSPPPGAPAAAELERLWLEFREWRAVHPAAVVRETAESGRFRIGAIRTLDHPAFKSSNLGYQAENLDILAHAGRPVDPWAGWAIAADPTAPWIFWYQPGPGAPVRGCLVDGTLIVRQLQSEFADSSVARVQLVPAGHGAVSDAATKLAALPAHRLLTEEGDVFREKVSRLRLTGAIGALLLALFLAGAAALTVLTRRAAREAERKITFVAQVSHELRSPITSIRMFADLLAAPEVAEAKRRKFAGTISREALRLSALIDRLLAFNALQRRARPVAPQPVDVVAVVRETADEMAGRLTEAGLAAALRLPDDTPIAQTDHSALKQALFNLLENAAKYARGSGPVEVSVESTATQVAVRVADRGPGLPRNVRARLFEPFVQGGQSLTDKSPGLGLGLSLARGLLRQTAGDLVLLDTPAGTVFEIRLPKASANTAETPT